MKQHANAKRAAQWRECESDCVLDRHGRRGWSLWEAVGCPGAMRTGRVGGLLVRRRRHGWGAKQTKMMICLPPQGIPPPSTQQPARPTAHTDSTQPALPPHPHRAPRYPYPARVEDHTPAKRGTFINKRPPTAPKINKLSKQGMFTKRVRVRFIRLNGLSIVLA